MIGTTVPWNASWSSEDRYEIRPCRWMEGALAIWSPHSPGVGKPIFAKPHMVRQRQSIAEMRCTVCGEKTPEADRFWFRQGAVQLGLFMTTEAPVHQDCGLHSLKVCPHLRQTGAVMAPMPKGAKVMATIVGGDAVRRDFGIDVGSRRVFGHLKLAWPASRVVPFGAVR